MRSISCHTLPLAAVLVRAFIWLSRFAHVHSSFPWSLRLRGRAFSLSHSLLCLPVYLSVCLFVCLSLLFFSTFIGHYTQGVGVRSSTEGMGIDRWDKHHTALIADTPSHYGALTALPGLSFSPVYLPVFLSFACSFLLHTFFFFFFTFSL